MIQVTLLKLFLAGTLTTAHPAAITAGGPLVSVTDQDESMAAAASTVPIEPQLSTKNCQNYPHPVWCYNDNGHQNFVNCFSTMCDAVAAGYTRCGKSRGPCD